MRAESRTMVARLRRSEERLG
eukprot:COSAG06_NODE_56030_length_286_cov_3.593583_1_plen_20_part_10